MTIHYYRIIPDKDHRFFIYEPESRMMFFRTKEERDATAKEVIQLYMSDDNLWSDEVTSIYAGEITHGIVETNRIDRPVDDEAEFSDKWGIHEGGDVDYIFDYELKELENDKIT